MFDLAILDSLNIDAPFHVGDRLHGSPGGSLYTVETTAGRLLGFYRERRDAEYVATALTALAATQDDAAPATAPSRIQRAAAIGVALHQKRAAVAALVAASGDTSTGRSANQHVLGGYQAAQHDQLAGEIDALERELLNLETA